MLIGRMRTPVWEALERMRTVVREAFSYGIRHAHCDSMSYDQIRIKPYPVSYRVYFGVANSTRQNACIEMHKISCKSLQKSDWSYGNERKTSPTNHTQFTWLKLWIKEENGVNKVTINLTSHHTGRVTIHFVCEEWRMKKRMRTAELVKIRRMIRGCGVWVNDSYPRSYRVMPYKSHTCTGWCRSYKVEWNKWFFISFLFCNKSYMFTWEKINDKIKKKIILFWNKQIFLVTSRGWIS